MFALFTSFRDEFVLQKLKKEAEDGAFIVRWSVLDYHRIILAALSRTKVVLKFCCRVVNICADNEFI